MPFIDDAHIIGRLGRIVTVERLQLFSQSCKKFILDFFMYINIIGSDAHLPVVGEFTPGDTRDRLRDISRFIDDCRRLAAQERCRSGLRCAAGPHMKRGRSAGALSAAD